MTIYHEFLVEGTDLDHCLAQVRRFLDLYELVSYQRVSHVRERSCRGSSPAFKERIEAALEENHRVLDGLIEELSATGLADLRGLAELRQGYETKVLHVICHFLDGFFGVDSRFYNLVDGSHWLFPETGERLSAEPGNFWLVAIEASTSTGVQALEKNPRAR